MSGYGYGYGRFLLRRTAGPLRVRSYSVPAERPTVAAPPQLQGRDAYFSPQSSVLAGKPLGEIVRSWIVFKLLGYDWIVRNSLTVLLSTRCMLLVATEFISSLFSHLRLRI